MSFKEKALAALIELKGDTTGIIAATIEDCEKVIRDIPEDDGWIPVTEPPKERDCYIVTVRHWVDGNPVSREAYWNGADWLSCDKRHELTPRVTHWMPLPEPPKEVEVCR